MVKRKSSASKIKRLNRRQRKKLRVGEFQELMFKVRMVFCQALDESAYDNFWNAFIDRVESRHLIVGGLGGRLPLMETDGTVAAQHGSPSDDDRQSILGWLQHHPEIARAEAGQFFDGWYSRK